MEFQQLIEERRSVRKYAAPAPEEDVKKILAMAQKAPSWKNGQPARVYAAEGEVLEELRERGLPSFNAANSRNASLLVTTFVKDGSGFRADKTPENDAGNEWGAYDLGLHDAFLILAAKDLGYDTLIMGIRDEAAIREILKVPETEQILSVIALGKAAEKPLTRPRKDLSEVTRFAGTKQ